jgi:hypothetical protein
MVLPAPMLPRPKLKAGGLLGHPKKGEILGRSSLAGPVEFAGKRVPILNIDDMARRRHWAASTRRMRHRNRLKHRYLIR